LRILNSIYFYCDYLRVKDVGSADESAVSVLVVVKIEDFITASAYKFALEVINASHVSLVVL